MDARELLERLGRLQNWAETHLLCYPPEHHLHALGRQAVELIDGGEL